ncbi:hypothetical protein AB0C40_16475 [Streptomyces brevispora]|uniref:hypothetical protein n=1 Tax=Streptomyces brevispora TaxID=887462 RepID=UPI0033C125F8
MPTAFEISARAVRQAASVLADHLQDGLPFRELRPLIHAADPALMRDWDALGASVTTDIDRNLSFTATRLTKAGWLTRANRTWRLTGLGVEALHVYSDPVAFFSEAGTRYDHWRTGRVFFDAAAKLLSELPDDRWVSVEDLAAEYEVDPEALAACLQGRAPRAGTSRSPLTARRVLASRCSRPKPTPGGRCLCAMSCTTKPPPASTPCGR